MTNKVVYIARSPWGRASPRYWGLEPPLRKTFINTE